jgi:hypothetical protein
MQRHRLANIAGARLSRSGPGKEYVMQVSFALIVRRWAFHGVLTPSRRLRLRIASEVPYVFDNLRGRNGAAIPPKDQEVAKMMNSYWINFAKAGDPNGPGLPKWPLFGPKTNEILGFKPDGSVAGERDPKKGGWI